MRLIRLTTRKQNGEIDTFFKENIHINPFSKIALGNISMESLNNTITINGTNHEVTFQCQTSSVRKIVLESAEYNSQNYQVILNDVIYKMNNILSISQPAELGKQVVLKADSTGKLQLKIQTAGLSMNGADLLSNVTTDASGSLLSMNSAVTILSCNQTTETTGYERASWYNNSLCRGAGVYRCKIRNLVDKGSGDDSQGAVVWLSKTSPSTFKDVTGTKRNPALTDIDVGISFSTPAQPYSIIINGAITTPNNPKNVNFASAGNPLNDIVAIEINSGAIELVIYSDAGAGGTSRHILNTGNQVINYDCISDKYYCCASIKSKDDSGTGGAQNCRLTKMNFTPHPEESLPDRESNQA